MIHDNWHDESNPDALNELHDLMLDQLKDMRRGSRQWPEGEVVMSLDRVLRRDGEGDWTLADYLDQDGRQTRGASR